MGIGQSPLAVHENKVATAATFARKIRFYVVWSCSFGRNNAALSFRATHPAWQTLLWHAVQFRLRPRCMNGGFPILLRGCLRKRIVSYCVQATPG
jgi:hypothetical protein